MLRYGIVGPVRVRYGLNETFDNFDLPLGSIGSINNFVRRLFSMMITFVLLLFSLGRFWCDKVIIKFIGLSIEKENVERRRKLRQNNSFTSIII